MKKIPKPTTENKTWLREKKKKKAFIDQTLSYRTECHGRLRELKEWHDQAWSGKVAFGYQCHELKNEDVFSIFMCYIFAQHVQFASADGKMNCKLGEKCGVKFVW